jgi:sRNA-binding protein
MTLVLKGEIMKRSYSKSKIDKVLAALVEKHPAAFFPKDSPDTKPLRIGIFTRVTAENPEFSRARIAAFMKDYTSKDRYLRALMTCPDRVEIDGSAFEPVLDDHRRFAFETLSKRQQNRFEREAA